MDVGVGVLVGVSVGVGELVGVGMIVAVGVGGISRATTMRPDQGPIIVMLSSSDISNSA